MRETGPNRFEGTLTDAASPVRVDVRRSGRIRYHGKDHLNFDQWLTPAGPTRVNNEMRVRRFGIIVARFRRGHPQAGLNATALLSRLKGRSTMASIAEQQDHKAGSMARVVIASSAGTAFEWYDFFIFGSLAPVISKVFFAGLDPTPALIAALALFAAGFAFRPLGALIFGVVGDRLGRKGAFLITVSLMGGATFLIGLLPTYAQAGRSARRF